MKTFKDLEFKAHPNFPQSGLQARLDFENGYGVSVVRFIMDNGMHGSYTSNDDEWELAVFFDGDITYSSGITEDVIGHLTEDEVTKVMEQVQKLS